MARPDTVQDRMMAVLADGERHTRDELFPCIGDELSSIENLKVHITLLRKSLVQQGKFLNGYIEYTETGRVFSYRVVDMSDRLTKI